MVTVEYSYVADLSIEICFMLSANIINALTEWTLKLKIMHSLSSNRQEWNQK